MIDSRNILPDFSSFVMNFRYVNRIIVLFLGGLLFQMKEMTASNGYHAVHVLVAIGSMPALPLLLPINADPFLFNCDTA